ncbi:MAG TPA: 1-acyl-sn-glycerol-3-phosphate acyltransferase [Lentimicrobium sp.]|nr:1-acyl-sn-glycerol-3-phosphate acyltransferase [Lentimicrobium sp.]
MILKYLAKTVLFLSGWKIIGELPPAKSVVAMAPHTSNLDFLLGWLGYTSVGIKSHFLIKKEIFKWYTSGIIKAMGGIPVDRSHSSNVVMQVTEEFHKRGNFIITITPEGTRKLVSNWKRGYYHIAMSAQVPICLGFLDYKNKEGGFGPCFKPTGNYEEDFRFLESFYRKKTARFPEKFSLSGIAKK